jgi:hypothetical protein
LRALQKSHPFGLPEPEDGGDVSPACCLAKSGAFLSNPLVQGGDGRPFLLQSIIGGCPLPKIIFRARRVALAWDKENAVGMNVVLKVCGLLGIGDFFQDFADATARIFANKFKLVLVPRHLFLQLLTHADESALAGAGMNEDMRVEVIGVVVEAVAVANRIARMKFFLKEAHRPLDNSSQGHVGIAARLDQRVVKLVGNRKDEPVMAHVGVATLLGVGFPRAAQPANDFLRGKGRRMAETSIRVFRHAVVQETPNVNLSHFFLGEIGQRFPRLGCVDLAALLRTDPVAVDFELRSFVQVTEINRTRPRVRFDDIDGFLEGDGFHAGKRRRRISSMRTEMIFRRVFSSSDHFRALAKSTARWMATLVLTPHLAARSRTLVSKPGSASKRMR